MSEPGSNWDRNLTRDEYRQVLSGVVNQLCTGLSTGVLVFLTGHAEDKAYRLVEALETKSSFVSVGALLSTALLEIPRSRRSFKALQILGEKAAKGPVCFYDVEILFDPGMELDVMSSLKILSKGREIYVDWPGDWDRGAQSLTFGEPKDPVYRVYPVNAEIGVVDLSGETYPVLEF